MITLRASEIRLMPNERERLNIIKQIKPLIDEGINILRDDGILPYYEIDELSFRIKEYLTREARTIAKRLETRYLGHKLVVPIKRPRRPKKLNI